MYLALGFVWLDTTRMQVMSLNKSIYDLKSSNRLRPQTQDCDEISVATILAISLSKVDKK